MPHVDMEATILVQKLAIEAMMTAAPEERKQIFRGHAEAKIRALRNILQNDLADAVARQMEKITLEYFP